MKIIDLLNKIANNDNPPKKIKFGGVIYTRYNDANTNEVIDYLNDIDNSLFDFVDNYRFKFCFIYICLEQKVEIVE